MKHLLKKELSELLNTQFWVSLLVTLVLVTVVGFVMTSTVSESVDSSGTIHVIDNDNSAFTKTVREELEANGYTVQCVQGTDYVQIMEERHWTEAVVLPEGFSDCLLQQKTQASLEQIQTLQSTSVVRMSLSQAISADVMQEAVKRILMRDALGASQEFLTNPVQEIPYTIANGAIAQASSWGIVSSMTLFDQMMPMVLFLLVILTSQTIITAIGAEKTDKTLETLLSAPVSRLSILQAKLLAALIVAVIYTLACGAGLLLTLLMNVGQTAEQVDLGQALQSILTTSQAVRTLGLEIHGIGWILVIAQFVMTICISLVVSLILGAFVQDAKSSQTASLPILLGTMFPYLLSMVSDIRQMGIAAKVILYLIPFTHTFIATGCLRFHDNGLLLFGLLYQAVFLAAMVLLALRVYQSDILFVHRSRHLRKKKNI